jgi:VWFA-related protein
MCSSEDEKMFAGMKSGMRNMAKSILVGILVAALCLSPASTRAQQPAAQAPAIPGAPEAASGQVQIPPPPPPTSQSAIQSNSELVRIDVEVTDKSGKAVKGLKADQFTVTDNGKPQKISTFTYSDIEAIQTAGDGDDNGQPVVVAVDTPRGTSADTVINQVRDRRMLVLYFDFTSLETQDLLRARDAALKFVRTQMSKADLVSVVVFDQKLSVWCDFTNDRDRIEKAVQQVTPGVAAQLADNSYAPAQNGEYDISEDNEAAFTADSTEFNVFNTDQKLEAVEGLSNVLSAIPGRKSVIQFTGGITQTGEENRTELRAATDAANRADVSIYEIDARGLYADVPGGSVSSAGASGTSMYTGAAVFQQTDARMDSRDTLGTLSTDTGGRSFFDLGDLSEAFPKIEEENTGYYLLGYYLEANVKHDGAWHALRVKVNAPGTHIRSRDGYYAPRDFQHLEKEDKNQQLDDAMNSANPVVELPIAVETAMFRLNERQVYVPISAKLSSSALDWAQKHGQSEAEFDFAAEVRAMPSGMSAAELRDTIHVKLDAQTFAQVSKSNLVYQGGVVLSTGRYHLKFIARENESGKIGTFEQDFIVQPAQPSKMTMSTVLLSSQLVTVEKTSAVSDKSQGTRAKLTTTPLEVEGQKIVPSVTRFFNQQQTLYVFFQTYYPDRGDQSDNLDPATLRAGLIFFRNGVQVNTTPMLAPTEVDPKSHTASYRISVPLAKLTSGRYTVQAVSIAAGTQFSVFGRAYLALQDAPVAPTPATGAGPGPGAGPGAAPASPQSP